MKDRRLEIPISAVSELSDEELIEKAYKLNIYLCVSMSMRIARTVPPTITDTATIFCEVLRRYNNKIKTT